MPAKVTKEAEHENNKEQRREEETSNGSNPFSDMKQQFLHFKRDKYLANIEHFQSLAQNPTPKTPGFVLPTFWDCNLEKLSWSET